MNTEYQEWKSKLGFKDSDIQDAEDSFSAPLKFGTAGLRGIMGIGTNRMNSFVVARAALSLAIYLKKLGENSAVISHDSRLNSREFAVISAEVMAKRGIKVYITRELAPTPLVAFAIRRLKTGGGIMVTASHNPKDYNGYKVYGGDGCQISGNYADDVWNILKDLDYFDIERADFDSELKKGNIEYIEQSLFEEYLGCVKEQGFRRFDGLKVCYTPLCGAGYKLVPQLLKEKGAALTGVDGQDLPDGNFLTCPYPNPEKAEAFSHAKKFAGADDCDIIIANDPDADRIGVMYRNNGGYTLLSGDEIGLLICNYVLQSKRNIADGSIIVRSIVTMTLCDRIAKSYGVTVKESFTGFKNICREALLLSQKGEGHKFILGYEESNGIAVGSYAFDKDGICAAMLLCEYAAALKERGQNFGSALREIYKQHGYMTSTLIAIKRQGLKGKQAINSAMQKFRELSPAEIGGYKVLRKKDYLTEDFKDMPRADVIIFEMEKDIRLALRPSGTEPLLKIYLQTTEKDHAAFDKLRDFVGKYIDIE